MNHQLDSRLRHLRLSGMAATLEIRNQEAIAASLSHREFLELLVEDELNTRRDRLLACRIKKAGFPALKTLEDFDWSFNTSINKRQLFDLATARFMTEGQGIHLQGPPGVGKSHLAIALGIIGSSTPATPCSTAPPWTCWRAWPRPRPWTSARP
jgi:DNA replication protein DnaC